MVVSEKSTVVSGKSLDCREEYIKFWRDALLRVLSVGVTVLIVEFGWLLTGKDDLVTFRWASGIEMMRTILFLIFNTVFWILFSADTIHLCLWPLQKYKGEPILQGESLIDPKFVIVRAVAVSCIGIAMGFYAALDNVLF